MIMKKKYLSLFIALLTTPCLWAQSADDASQCVVESRASFNVEDFEAPVRKAKKRFNAPAANWSYPTATPQNAFAGGSGTAAAPYQIATAQQLANMAYLVNTQASYRTMHYELVQDIVLNTDVLNDDRSLKNVGAAWTPIGLSTSTPFKGTFNGNNHSISGMYMHTQNRFNGLFGYAENATIKNVGTIDGFVYGCCRVAGIVGHCKATTISNCYNTNTLYSKSSGTAGIAGRTDGATTLTACYNGGFVYGYGQSCTHGFNGNCVGGVAGAVGTGGTVTYSYNTGEVYGGAYSVGGICSPVNNSGPTVSNCHNVGKVSSHNPSSSGGILADCAAHGFSIKPTYSNNYALEGVAQYNRLTTAVKDAAAFADKTVLNLLDNNGSYFKQGSEYPILSYVSEKPVVTENILYNGQCGEDAWWKITDQGELIIYGTGNMFNYGDEAIAYIKQVTPQVILAGIAKAGNVAVFIAGVKKYIEKDATSMGLAPWVNYSAQIKKITVQEGITTIGQGAFLLLTSATEATIPSTITEVGSGAFAFCSTLANLYSYAPIPPAMTGEMKEYTFCYTANADTQNYNNPQSLLHVPSASAASYKVAEGWKLFNNMLPDLAIQEAAALALTDSNTKLVAGFYKAGNVSYTRTGNEAGSYVSLCLPFAINLDAVSGIEAAYVPLDFAFFNENTGKLSLSFVQQTGIIEAGMPFIAKLNGSELLLKSYTDVKLTGYEAPMQQSLKVFTNTQIGGILTPSTAITLNWGGTFTAANVQNAWLFATDGTLATGTQAAPFRTVVNATNTGSIALQGINAIVSNPCTGILGDLNGDGVVDVIDLNCLGNIIVYGHPEGKQ